MPEKYGSDFRGNNGDQNPAEQGGNRLDTASETAMPTGLDSLEDIESFVKNLEEEVAALKKGDGASLDGEPQQPALRDRASRDRESRDLEAMPHPDRMTSADARKTGFVQETKAAGIADGGVREGVSDHSQVESPHSGSAAVASAPPRPIQEEIGGKSALREPRETEQKSAGSDGSSASEGAIASQSASKREDPYAAPRKFDPWQSIFETEGRQPAEGRTKREPGAMSSSSRLEQSFQPRTFEFDPNRPFIPDQTVVLPIEKAEDKAGEESKRAAQDLVSSLSFSYEAPSPYGTPKIKIEEEREKPEPDAIDGGGLSAFVSDYAESKGQTGLEPSMELDFATPYRGAERTDRIDFSLHETSLAATPALPEITMPSYASFEEEAPFVREESGADAPPALLWERETDFATGDDMRSGESEKLSDKARTVNPWYPKDIYTSGEEGYSLKPAEDERAAGHPGKEEQAYFAHGDAPSGFSFGAELSKGTQDDAMALIPAAEFGFSETQLAEELPGLKENLFEELSEPYAFTGRISPYTPWEDEKGSFAAWGDSGAQRQNTAEHIISAAGTEEAPAASDAIFFDGFYFGQPEAESAEQENLSADSASVEEFEKDSVIGAPYKSEEPFKFPTERDKTPPSFEGETEGPQEDTLDIPFERELPQQMFDGSGAKEQQEDSMSASSPSPFADIAELTDRVAPSDTNLQPQPQREGVREAETSHEAQWSTSGYSTLADKPDYLPPVDVLTQPEIDVIVEQESEAAPHPKVTAEYKPSPFETISKEAPRDEKAERAPFEENDAGSVADFRNDGFELGALSSEKQQRDEAEKPEKAAESSALTETVETLQRDVPEERGREETHAGPVDEADSDKAYSLFGELVTPIVGEPLAADKDGNTKLSGIAEMFGALDLSREPVGTADISAMIDSLSGAAEEKAELPMQTHLELPSETDESSPEMPVVLKETAIAEPEGTVSLADIVPLGQVKDELLEEQPERYSFEGISDHLEAGMIVSDIQAKYSENNLLPYEEETYLTFHDITSIYNMKFQNGTSRPLYENLNVSVPKGSCTAFVSETPLDVHALLRATKNRAGIKEGYISVGDKRSEDSPNLLYIENDSMITFGMPALQFLMLCLSEVKDRPAAKQEKLLNILDDVGLSQIALVDTKLLTKFQRIALLLLTVAMSNLIDGVVLNPNKLPLDMADEFVIRRVFKLLHDTGKTVLVVGNNLVLTSCVANRIVALSEGQLVFDGDFPDFVEHFCDSTFSFSTKDTEFVMRLREDFPDAKYEKRADRVTVRYTGGDTDYLTTIVARILDAGIEGRTIATKKKSFERAIGRMVEA